ncbi:MAG: MinD/ParA family protein [Promethearchaeota archaeon]|nr:MAG: MinD/ParA family protein [Candidatus Lokiarchaeota archaeon]
MGKTVSVHSFRGGTGKSNITANLATYCAMQGAKVGVIDTDIQSPGVHVIFGLGNKKLKNTLNDFLFKKCDIDSVAVDVTKNLKIKGDGKLYVFPAALDANEITKVLREGYEVTNMSEGFSEIMGSKSLDYLFIDTHPGLNEETFLSIALSDILLVILRPDEQDYLGTAVTLEISKKFEIPKIFLIMNKLLPKYKINEVTSKLTKTFHVPVAGIIYFSEEFADAASKDVFIVNNPEHAFSKIISEVYGHLIED